MNKSAEKSGQRFYVFKEYIIPFRAKLCVNITIWQKKKYLMSFIMFLFKFK